MKKNVALLVILLCTIAFAESYTQPKIAVYVTGDLNANEKRMFGAEVLNALVRSERFTPIEDAALFTAEIEQKAATQVVDDDLIYQLGRQFDVRWVCVVDAVSAFGSYQISARLLNVRRAEVNTSERISGQLNSVEALEALSVGIVNKMLGISNDTDAPASKSVSASTQGPLKVAVYITGGPLGKVLSPPINKALLKSGIYAGIESIDEFANSTTDDRQISSAGVQAGVHYVFVVDITSPISVRIIDVASAAVMARISIDGKVSAVNAALTAKKIVDFILKSGPQPNPDAQMAGSTGEQKVEKIRSDFESQAKNVVLVDVGPFFVGIFANTNVFAIGLQYERMLSEKFSIAGRYDYLGNSEVYFTSFEVHARIYPYVGTFFLDGMIAYGRLKYEIYVDNYYYDSSYYTTLKEGYFKLGLSLGWQRTFGRSEKFIWEISTGYHIASGVSDRIDKTERNLLVNGPRLVTAVGRRF